MILVFKNHKTSNQNYSHLGSNYLGNLVLGHQQGGKNQRRRRTWGHGRFFASWRWCCLLFWSQGGGNLVWVLCPSCDQTLRAQQNKLHKNKHNTKVVHNSNFFFLPFPPDPADPLEELLCNFFDSLSKISSASSPTIRSNPES